MAPTAASPARRGQTALVVTESPRPTGERSRSGPSDFPAETRAAVSRARPTQQAQTGTVNRHPPVPCQGIGRRGRAWPTVAGPARFPATSDRGAGSRPRRAFRPPGRWGFAPCSTHEGEEVCCISRADRPAPGIMRSSVKQGRGRQNPAVLVARHHSHQEGPGWPIAVTEKLSAVPRRSGSPINAGQQGRPAAAFMLNRRRRRPNRRQQPVPRSTPRKNVAGRSRRRIGPYIAKSIKIPFEHVPWRRRRIETSLPAERSI